MCLYDRQIWGCNGFDGLFNSTSRSAVMALTISRFQINGKSKKTTEELAKETFFMQAASTNSLAFA